MKNTVGILLDSKAMSVAGFANEIGVSRQTINNIVKGRTPSLEVSIKIAKYFGKDVMDIFFLQNVKHVAKKSKAS